MDLMSKRPGISSLAWLQSHLKLCIFQQMCHTWNMNELHPNDKKEKSWLISKKCTKNFTYLHAIHTKRNQTTGDTPKTKEINYFSWNIDIDRRQYSKYKYFFKRSLRFGKLYLCKVLPNEAKNCSKKTRTVRDIVKHVIQQKFAFETSFRFCSCSMTTWA